MALVLRNGHGVAARSDRFKKLSPEEARALVSASKEETGVNKGLYTANIKSSEGKVEKISFRSRKTQAA